MGERTRKRRQQRLTVSYRCASCSFEEQIPEEVLAHFDLVDPGLPGQPATFRCKRCPGIMYPAWWFEDKPGDQVPQRPREAR